jgi:hypothetical protein
MSEPHPRVSAAKYAAQPARVRWRIKGGEGGALYSGTRLLSACRTCGGKAAAEGARAFDTRRAL